jgi:hypothetical protein
MPHSGSSGKGDRWNEWRIGQLNSEQNFSGKLALAAGTGSAVTEKTSRVGADATKLLQDGALQGRGRHAARFTLGPTPLVRLHAYVIAIDAHLFLDVGMDDTDIAGGVTHDALQQRPLLVAVIAPAVPSVAVDRRLDLIPDFIVDDPRVLALVHLAAILYLAQLDHVGEQ